MRGATTTRYCFNFGVQWSFKQCHLHCNSLQSRPPQRTNWCKMWQDLHPEILYSDTHSHANTRNVLSQSQKHAQPIPLFPRPPAAILKSSIYIHKFRRPWWRHLILYPADVKMQTNSRKQTWRLLKSYITAALQFTVKIQTSKMFLPLATPRH